MSRRRLAVAIAALALASAQASTLYRWTDADGRVHYADRVDARHAEGVERIAMRAEPVAVARLRVVPDAIGAQAWVDNLLAGPIEVMLHADGVAYASEPALPARATIPPYSRALLARIAQGNPRLLVAAVPGSPSARPRDVEYAWPLPSAPLRIQQAWGGSHSHRDAENRYAVDFAAPVGTPVVAARDGLVIQAEADYGEADGEDEASLLARANFIRVLHDDGTMALYAHLQTGGVLVRPGERVRRGQSIGRSGNTGLSTAPHLHFVVQANRGMRMEAVPFRMFGPHGILRFGEARGLEPPAD
ncbi:peptidoglycan DD-metalloendopeptidase family protein [Luteimonas sp. SDU82]|uniref:peptidoglycan DD-metalloendopeptidase family protein n=1 Tax=Luteimonas sp. SDU82 TaxID=3422592 RepID=UPI003EBE7CCF